MNPDHETKRLLVRQHLIEANEFPLIPDGWGVERLRFLFRESKERNGESPVGQMLSVSEYRGVVPREYDTEEQKRTDEELANYLVVRPGQLAVNSMWLNHLGLGVSDHEGHVSPAYEVYDISDRLDRRFVHHLMRSNYYLKIYMRYLYGIRPNSFQIKADDWKSIPIIVPDLTTQRQIADFLDRETARIDLLIEKKQRMVELLPEKEKAAISRLVMRGEWFGSSLMASDLEWRGLVPSHWKESRLKAQFRPVKRQGFDSLTVLSVYREFGVIEKSSRDDNINKTPEDLSKYQLVESGDLVINKMKAWQGSLGVSTHRGITSPDYVVMKPIGKHVPAYMHHLLRARPMPTVYQMISNGIRTDQWRMEPEKFLSLPVFLPPVEEQLRIVSMVSLELGQLRTVADAIENSITRLREYRSALITAAVTGQIDPTTHDRAGHTDRQLDAMEAG